MGNSPYLKGIIAFLGHVWVKIVGGSLVVFQLLHNGRPSVQIYIIISGCIICFFPSGPAPAAAPLRILRRVIGPFDTGCLKDHLQLVP